MVALLLSSGVAEASRLKAAEDDKGTAKDTSDLNPEFVSTMTRDHWRLYKPDETLAMFQRAEYKVNKLKNDVHKNGVRISVSQDNLDEAQRYLRQAENTIVKLKTELVNYAKKQTHLKDQQERENKLFKDAKDALKEKENIDKAKEKAL